MPADRKNKPKGNEEPGKNRILFKNCFFFLKKRDFALVFLLLKHYFTLLRVFVEVFEKAKI